MAEAGPAGGRPGPRIEWDSGTAYDFFASFWILHQPEEFGLRRSWAAGVRSRLSEESRRFMADALRFVRVPLGWIHGLPAPRDSRVAIQELERTEPADIAAAVVRQCCDDEPKLRGVLERVLAERRWRREDLDELCSVEAAMAPRGRREADRQRIERWLVALSRPEEFGRSVLRGLSEYRESFFREEERRIAPAVERALEAARERARSRAAADLLEELSQGLRIGHLLQRPRLVLVPCYWCSPRIIYGTTGTDGWVVLFGARPAEDSLVPEDRVPAALSLALAALDDSTRLNVLRILRDSPLTQAEIARRLRLRPSTISHHLKSLRIAGLISYIEPEGSELRYELREARIQEFCRLLAAFLDVPAVAPPVRKRAGG